MKQQKRAFVNPFRNILFKICFCAELGVGSHPKRFLHRHPAVTMERGSLALRAP
jgi:hypothetical protein